MSLKRICDPDALRPYHVVLIALVALTVGGGMLLLSAAESRELVDGARPWTQDSPLRAVVQLLCLNYRYPTIHQGAIKLLILGLGAGLATITVALAIGVGPRGDGDAADARTSPSEASQSGTQQARAAGKAHVPPVIAAQVLVLLYLAWSFSSSQWSAAPALAVGGSVLLAIHFLWALAVGNGLHRRAASLASRAIVVVTLAASIVAIWYFYGRNPEIRAKFPFGNPTFLAASLIPGLLLAVTLTRHSLGQVWQRRGAGRWWLAGLGVSTIVLGLLAFYLADSRGPMVGLAVGAVAMIGFALPGWRRWLLLGIGGAMLAVAVLAVSAAGQGQSRQGRDASARFRMYSWTYAWQMFGERPYFGHGQGGYVLKGDAYTVKDVERDPLALGTRIAHAHCEWLEVLADLGAVGLVLILAAIGATLHAGLLALDARPPPGRRRALVALMGALVGLAVEECFGVGLRVSGVSTMFFTVLGLIWAMSSSTGGRGLVASLSSRKVRGVVAGVLGTALGVAVAIVSTLDFTSARSAHLVGEHLAAGEFDEAIRLASAGTERRNPQRALTNLFRLAEAHLRVAITVQQRAMDRQARALAQDPPNAHLARLARQDFQTSEAHCIAAGTALMDLVKRSPGFFNHGWLEYLLNITRARNLFADQDPSERELLYKNAAAAVQRELSRQPFNPTITIAYLDTIAARANPAHMLDVLARPLRHNELAPPHVDWLTKMMGDQTFAGAFPTLVEKARASLALAVADSAAMEDADPWAPEKMRIAATVHYVRGEYGQAVAVLRAAEPAYERIAPDAPIGAASFFSELAACLFYERPAEPDLALTAAKRALEALPGSQLGRRLGNRVRSMMIAYHLAGGNEDEARALIGKLAPKNATEAELQASLGTQYSAMCYRLLTRRMGQLLRMPPSSLPGGYARWVDRAIELTPQDPLARQLAADLAERAGDDRGVAHHLRIALEHGLDLEIARAFLLTARDKLAQHDAIDDLLDALGPPPNAPPPRVRDDTTAPTPRADDSPDKAETPTTGNTS